MAQSCIFRFGLNPIGHSFLAGGSLFVSSWNSRGAPEIKLARGNAGDSIMVDQEVLDSQLKADRFPFPSEGDITLRVRNANYTLGPVMLHVVMNPGATIPAHLHKGMAEALYVAEGDFTNEGKQYQAGTSLHFKAGKAHGPHSTKNGCKLLVLWTERTSKEAADLTDFMLATRKAA